MDSTDAPVSTAVELATLAIKAFLYFAETLRCGLVSMSDLFFMAVVLCPIYSTLHHDVDLGYLKFTFFLKFTFSDVQLLSLEARHVTI